MGKGMTVLVNFRIDNELKETFDDVCKFNHSNRTTTLIGLIRRYVSEMANQIEEFNKSKISVQKHLKERRRSELFENRYDAPTETQNSFERWGNLIKDPSTQTWISIDDF